MSYALGLIGVLGLVALWGGRRRKPPLARGDHPLACLDERRV